MIVSDVMLEWQESSYRTFCASDPISRITAGPEWHRFHI